MGLMALIGAGCYELRRKDSGEMVLFGKSRNVASRNDSAAA